MQQSCDDFVAVVGPILGRQVSVKPQGAQAGLFTYIPRFRAKGQGKVSGLFTLQGESNR